MVALIISVASAQAQKSQVIAHRALWKPMHLQPVYAANPAYVNGVSEDLFKRGLCLPSGPYVTDEDVRYIVNEMKKSIL